jgi:hypothetical protein
VIPLAGKRALPNVEGHNVTVCVVGLFNWNYGTLQAPVIGKVAITASDRKITAGNVEYEPSQLKMSFMTRRACILISGDYSLHSEALYETNKQVKADASIAPHNLALIYGRAIQNIKRREAEDIFLAPIGMNTDTFVAQQRDFTEGFIEKITHQLQTYEGEDVEALVVASDGENANLHSINSRGSVSVMNDIGFAAIGIGAWHAKSRLMEVGYVNNWFFAPALAAIFAAKCAAETAPGVGKDTDMHLVFKNGVEQIPSDLFGKLKELYQNYENKRTSLQREVVDELQTFIDETAKKTAESKPNSSQQQSTQTEATQSETNPEQTANGS